MHAIDTLKIKTMPRQLNEFTAEVKEVLRAKGFSHGLVTLFCKHTSCSLVIMENADPTAQRDLEGYMERLVPEGDPNFTHNYEGSDDMPSHIKMALTRTSESIPFVDGSLCLGTWQGIFLWEHRANPHLRQIVVCVDGHRN